MRRFLAILIVFSSIIVNTPTQARIDALLTSEQPTAPPDSQTLKSSRLQTDTESIEFVGHLGGVTLAADVQDDYAYVGEGPRLTILDISNPVAPTVVGKTSPMFDIVRGVEVVETLAYVANGSAGMRVVDVSDPFNPVEVGAYDTPCSAENIVVDGELAFVADGSQGLRVLDISTPSNPIEIGAHTMPGTANDVALAGNYAFVAARTGGLRVIDISTPSHPVEVNHMPEEINHVAVEGNIAYTTRHCPGLLRVIDISTPSEPREIASYDMPGDTQEVIIKEDLAYVADGCQGLQVIDVSSPSQPIALGAYNTPDFATDLAILDHTAYIADRKEGLRAVNISNPSNLSEIGSYNTLGSPEAVVVIGSTAYVADGSAGLKLVNITDPSIPTEIASYNTPGWAKDVAVDGDRAYVADMHGGLRMVDISTPSSLTEIGFYDLPGYAEAVAVVDDTAYIANGSNGLRLVDISEPANSAEIGVCETLGYAADVTVVHDNAYIADTWEGLHVVDISMPSEPTKIGTCAPSTHGYDVTVSGNHAYLAEGSAGLSVVDISRPDQPTEIGFNDLVAAEAVKIEGDTAYVASGCQGSLRAIDVSTPSNPVEIAGFDTPGDAKNLAVLGGIVYVANGDAGLTILRFADGETAYSISGHVRDAGNHPIPDARIATEASGFTNTDKDGTYTLINLVPGTYTITPSKPGWVFNPPTRTVTVPPEATGQDFTMLHPPVSTTLMLSGTGSLSNALIYTDTQGLTTTLTFPRGAVTETTTIVLTPTVVSSSADLAFAGHAFDLTAYQNGQRQADFTFNELVTVTIHYSEQDVRLISDEGLMTLRWWNGDTWRDAVETCDPPSTYNRDEVNDLLEIPICHLSTFGLFGPTNRVYLPLVTRDR